MQSRILVKGELDSCLRCQYTHHYNALERHSLTLYDIDCLADGPASRKHWFEDEYIYDTCQQHEPDPSGHMSGSLNAPPSAILLGSLEYRCVGRQVSSSR